MTALHLTGCGGAPSSGDAGLWRMCFGARIVGTDCDAQATPRGLQVAPRGLDEMTVSRFTDHRCDEAPVEGRGVVAATLHASPSLNLHLGRGCQCLLKTDPLVPSEY